MSVAAVTISDILVSDFGEYDPPHREEWRFEYEHVRLFSDGVEAHCRLPLEPSWKDAHFNTMPGVLYAEVAAQLLLRFAATRCKQEEICELEPALAGLDEWRFRARARPGDVLRVELKNGRARGHFWFVDAVITNAATGKPMAQGKLSGGLIKRQN